MRSDNVAVGFVIGACFAISLMIVAHAWTNAERAQEVRARAIQKGSAIYSTDAGTFTWIDERVKFIVEGK
jgi:hypothetical protein